MPSIATGYEHDVFISYRHKDNRAGWVTHFVDALKDELDATFKENISIYFDESPHDGLLETHSVDKSLEIRLKSLVFIPIVSQTYCDPKSFAWQNEFCAFNSMALKEPVGRDIKISNGNIASRILPLTIHSLEKSDLALIENELQTKYRGIDFMFKAPGVNRALMPSDKAGDNTYQLTYRNQLNKLANAIKEVIYGIVYPDKTLHITKTFSDPDSQYLSEGKLTDATTQRSVPNDNSIAVLPFVSLAKDNAQDYFADGIAENILMLLANLKQLRVISRTSVMQYKKTTKAVPEIAKELGVKFILEGSAQSAGNKVRINAQLINAALDEPVWSRTFVENLDDIFALQDKVANIVATQLNASINQKDTSNVHQVPTRNLEAYDQFLKGRHAFNQWTLEGYKTASTYFKSAIEIDPDFKEAYSYMASSYSARMSWNGDLSPVEAKPLITQYLDEAMKRGATDNDYLTKGFVELFIEKNFAATAQYLNKALELNPNNATVLYTYSYLLCMMGRMEQSHEIINKAKQIEPHSVAYFNYEALYLYLTRQYEHAIVLLKEGLQLFPQVIRFNDYMGRIYLTVERYAEARQILLSSLRQSAFRPPSMVAYLATAHFHLSEEEKGEELMTELKARSNSQEKGVNYYVSLAYAAGGKIEDARTWMAKATQTNDIDLIWLGVDPLMEGVREELAKDPDFVSAEAFILEKLKKELPDNLYYHNIDHTYDVLESALRIATHQQLDLAQIPLLRIAALFHDSGFTSTYKNHEQKGCELARQVLPAYGFTEEQLVAICGMIMATKIPQSPQNDIEKILCDADLDYLGRDDFYEIGNRLFKELKQQGYIETEREWNLTQKVFLENHHYHTDYARINREGKKQKHLNEVLDKLKR